MSLQVNPTGPKSTSQAVANGVRKGVKIAAMANPTTLALLHFSKNFANGDTFGQALDRTLDQVAADYQGVAAPVLNNAKKVAQKGTEMAKKMYEASKPKDKVEMGLMMAYPCTGVIPVKRAVTAFVNDIQAQWNSLPTLNKK